MSVPVFWLPEHAVVGIRAGARVRLDGPEGHHAADVRRLRLGERVELVDGSGLRVSGSIASVIRGEVVVTVGALVREPAPLPRVVVVQALPKGDRAELAVQLLSEVGVDEIVPWAAARCVSTWRGDRLERGAARWRSVAREASKQSRRARAPVVAPLATTAEVAALLASAALAVVLHESAAQRLPTVVPAGGEVAVVVGPEGGITDEELTAFAAAHVVRLGPTVLRTSTAGAVAVAALLSRTPRWS